jgi:YidC/Oxa1 family membrane protein insertase
MDRNAITGIFLITLLTLGYFYFFAPKPPEPQSQSQSTQTETPETQSPSELAAQPNKVATLTDSLVADSLADAQMRDKFSDLVVAAQGESRMITVLTEELDLRLDTKGGALHEAFLVHYQTHDSLPLPVYTANSGNEFYFEFVYNNRAIRSDNLYFEPSYESIEVTGDDSVTLVMRAEIDENRAIEQIYTFYGQGFDYHYEIRLQGIREALGNYSFYELQWTSFLPKTELSLENMRQKSMIAYKVGDDVEKMSITDDTEEEKLQTPIKWVSYKSQFFSHILVADEPFRSGVLEMRTPATERINRVMNAKLIIDIDRSEDIQRGFMVYMGPNEYTTLTSYKGLDLQKEMDLGWSFVAYINIGTTYVFKFLEKYIDNYGLIIIIVAILIRLLVFPLTYKSYVSMAKMRVINQTPEIKALDEKHKDDPQKLQMAKMGIYKQMGVSMFGGCLPMLLSYPFLIALFFFFPQSVELRQQSFLWANDLSTYDSIVKLPFEIPIYGDHVSLFCLLMAISTFVYTYFQQASQPSAGSGPQAQMKYIAYFMPLFLLFFLNNYASGLSLYYLVSNIFSISQTTLIRFTLNDEKLLAEMREKAKAKKKGKKGKGGKGGKGGGETGSKSRIERWMEKQQKKQEEIMRQRKQEQAPNRRARRNKKD